MIRRLLFLVPLAVFAVLVAYFALGLTKDPRKLDSVLINQPFPELKLAAIEGRKEGFSTADLRGQVTLVNIWGSWCAACRIEHPFLMQLKEKNLVPVYGIDWREKDPRDGPEWLKRFGDPYQRIGVDPESKAAIALGVTGAPETFVVDRNAVIRYKVVGPLVPEVWDQTVGPLVERLRKG